MKEVDYRVKEDEFTGINVLYDTEDGRTISACCRIGALGAKTRNKAATVGYLCALLDIACKNKSGD